MRNYDRVHLRKPEGIEERKAYIIVGGIAGLSAAAFLVRDAQMPGKNITVYDQLPVFGGSMDCAGASETGYVSRGERELEPYMECLWDLFGSIPSLYEEGRTVLDETRKCNKNWEIDSKHRLWEQGFQPHDESTMGVTPEIQQQMIEMMLTEEDRLEDVTIEQWFSPAFFQSQLWYYWSSMLAFQPYHSLIEMRRYAVRFMHQLHLIKSLRGILRTKYDQYNSLIRPLEVYLADHGVNFVSGATVTDMDIRIEGIDKTVTTLHIGEGSDEQIVPIAEKDLVFFTNGSMTQNSTQGSMTEALVMNRDTVHKGCFSLWEKLAPDQPENVQFMWFYGLHANNCDTYVKKPMTECSGEEIMREFLYYCGLEDKIGVSDLPKVKPLKLPQTMHEIVEAINQIPPMPEYYAERKENL